MTWTARILITILTIASITTGTNSSAEAESTIQPQPLGEATPLNIAEAELMAWGAELFSTNDMELPSGLVPSFHEDEADCENNLGLFSVENDTLRVRVCWTHEDPGVQRRLQEQALVHELAHAWVHENVSEDTKETFMGLTGAESWNLRATDWTHRGTERAADLITWALLDPAVLFVDFSEVSCNELAAAFELLTGTDAPATISAAC